VEERQIAAAVWMRDIDEVERGVARQDMQPASSGRRTAKAARLAVKRCRRFRLGSSNHLAGLVGQCFITTMHPGHVLLRQHCADYV
jgi:hypothetical protein